jgi:hypothetical protein
MTGRKRSAPFLVLPLLGLAAGCGQDATPRPITEKRIAASPWPAGIPQLSSAQRFGLADSGEEGSEQNARPRFRYELPKGWKEQAEREFRTPNLLVAGNAEAECYLSVLPGSGGGVAMNVNRWRGQMELEPLDEAAIAKLPREKLAGLSVEAVRADFEGSYRGMGMEAARPGFRFLGVIFEVPGHLITVRISGPKDLLAKELPAFEGFLASLRLEAPAKAAPAPGHAAGGGASGLSWDLPKGWREVPAGVMQLATFKLGEGERTDCSISEAMGDLLGNLNRWRGQMGLEPAAEAAAAALPEVEVLGGKARLVELAGTFKGRGGAAIDNAKMLGVILPRPGSSLFVKMVGPGADVDAARDGFLALCKSLRPAAGGGK